MKWQSKQQKLMAFYQSNEYSHKYRTITKFLFLPLKLNEFTHWFEIVKIRQKLEYDRNWLMNYRYYWKNVNLDN